MKAKILVPALIASLLTSALAQTNFYEQVSSLWFSGDKQGVLDIANQRLAQNSNDLAGLLLKLEYEIEFLQTNNIPSTITRIMEVGGVYTGENFAQQFPVLEADFEVIIAVITNYPSDQLSADQAKSGISGKPLTYGDEIKALQDDGYFQ